MLVNCPKCGFTQPKDQYCAQCGVDMIAFKPPAVPLAKKIFGNPILQISLVLIIAASGGYSIYLQRQSDLAERVRYLQGGAQVARSVSSGESLDSQEQDDVSFETTPAPENLPESDSGSVVETASLAGPAASSPSAAEAASPETAEAKTANTTVNHRVRFVFAEISQVGLARVFEESRATGQFNQIGDHDAGLIPQVAQKVSGNLPEIKILHQVERPLQSGLLQFFVGVQPGDPENELGFTIYIERTEAEGGLSRGSLEIVRSWRERFSPTEPLLIQRKNYPAVFEVAPGTGFFMSGLLPASGLVASDEELVNSPPFQIFRSNSFRSGASEMILFVEFLK